jgi:hypothetical protein
MTRILMAMALSLLATSAHAGPFSRRVTTTRASTCSGGTCSTASSRTVTRGAQGHAEAMAASGSMVHAASHGATYEGVGVGGSPAAALASCCNNGGAVVDQGGLLQQKPYVLRRHQRVSPETQRQQ